ncbi:Hsp70 family protein [Pseudonocardia sp. RS010]|uniref:Hsp70 family protein n=1 Tax=Pseudonocardia sp. RS010 TaxID=3385979 RepID=UPI0039A2E616
MTYTLGVDLGTTFVAAAIGQGARVEMFTLGERSIVSPAVVYVRKDGAVVTGDPASLRAVRCPDRVGREFKRRLGDPTPVTLGGQPYGVTTLLAALLQDVVQRVVAHQGAEPDGVVLTHPANWGPFRRGLFEEVAELAGLPGARMITEPEAAAAHYASSRRLADGEIVAVYDLGGGTFDATLLRRRANRIDILGMPEGIERLGGIDFDEAILAHVKYSAAAAFAELDMRDPQTTVALARLRQDCVAAKEALSVDVQTTIPVFLPNQHFEVDLTRADFEGMIRAPIESTISALTRTLASADVAPEQVSAVLLVGGSSRIPLVARMIGQELGRPTVVDAHPKHSVALGAARLAEDGVGHSRAGHTAAVLGPPSESAPSILAPPAAHKRGPLPESTKPSGPSSSLSVGSGAAEKVPGPPAGDESGLVSRLRRAHAAASPRRPLLVLASLVAVVAALAGLSAVVLPLTRSSTDPSEAARIPTGPVLSTTSGTSVPATPTSAAPTSAMSSPPQLAQSVPTPTVKSTVSAGPMPNFIAIAPNGRFAYIANRTAGVVSVLETATNELTATIPVTAGPPQYVTFAPDGSRAYVSVFDDAGRVAVIAVIDTSANAVIATIPVTSRPYIPAVSPDGAEVYVPDHDSAAISVIETATGAVSMDLKVAPNPHWIEFSSDGARAYSADHESNEVVVIDTRNHLIVARVPVEMSPHSLAVHPNRPLLAVVNEDSGTVAMIDTRSDTIITTVPVGKNPASVSWAPDGRFAYVPNADDDTVSVISADTFTVTATVPTGDNPTRVAVGPDGRSGYVTNRSSGTLTVLNLAG